jgi:hypothetical protein
MWKQLIIWKKRGETMNIENKVLDFEEYFVGTVVDYNQKTRMVSAFIPKIMPGIANGRGFSSTVATTTGTTKITGLTDYNSVITLRNSLWLKPLDWNEPLPKPGSKVLIYFIDGNPKLGFWIPFNPNNDYTVIDQEKYKNLFRLNIQDKMINVTDSDIIQINFPDSFKSIYSENDKHKTISLNRREDYLITNLEPIEPHNGTIWFSPDSGELKIFIQGEFKKLALEEQVLEIRENLTAFVDGERWVDIPNKKLYIYNGELWIGEDIYTEKPIDYSDGESWVDPETGVIYTYDLSLNEWIPGDVAYLTDLTIYKENDKWINLNTYEVQEFDSNNIWVSLGNSSLSEPIQYQEGDSWFDSSTYSLYIYSNGSWTLQQVLPTTIPSDPEEGELWYNVDDDEIFVFNGESWVELQISRTEPIEYILGDMWYDVVNNILYTFDGSNWNDGETPYTEDPILYKDNDKWINLDTYEVNNLSGSTWISLGTAYSNEPIQYQEGDFWFDTTSYTLYNFTGGLWDSGIVIPTIKPVSPLENDFWYDEADSDILFIYSGTEWFDSQVSRVAPINYISGDMWYDLENNILYTFDGSNWNDGETPYTEEPLIYRDGDLWYDKDNFTLYEFVGNYWNSGELLVSGTPVFYVQDDKWYDIKNRYLYTYDGLEWDRGYYVPAKAPLGGI